MPVTESITPEKREEIIRKYVRALPTERKAICEEYGISASLPYYWRTRGLWPKDLVFPPPGPLPPSPAAQEPLPLAVTAGVPARALTPEQRQDLGRRFAALRPDERSGFAKTIGISRSLLYDYSHGRKLGLHGGAKGPKPRKPIEPLASEATVIPRDTKDNPYTPEERLAIKAEHQRARAKGLDAVIEFGKKWGKPTWLYQSAAKLAKTRIPPTEAFKKEAVRRIEELLAADPLRSAGEVIPQVIKELGHSMHWTSYYTWRKTYGAKATKAPPTAPVAKRRSVFRNKPIIDKVGRHLYSVQEKRDAVAAVNALRAKGLEVADACTQTGVLRDNYYHWQRGYGMKSQNGRPPAQASPPPLATNWRTTKPGKAALVALSNRALQQANGGPRMASAVGSLVQRFVQELAAMGAEIQELKTDGDGHCTVSVRTTETFKI